MAGGYIYAPDYTSGYIGTSSTTTSGYIEYPNSPSVDYNNIPEEVEDAIEAIMGKPGGAKFLISYAYKKSKDPVIFIHSKKAMLKELKKLLKDERVDKRTILVSEIKKQWKPSKKLLNL